MAPEPKLIFFARNFTFAARAVAEFPKFFAIFKLL